MRLRLYTRIEAPRPSNTDDNDTDCVVRVSSIPVFGSSGGGVVGVGVGVYSIVLVTVGLGVGVAVG